MGDDEDSTPGSDGEGELVPFDTERRFAANLRLYRERKGMTQAQLADEMTSRGLAGWRQQTVTRVESGHRRVWLGEAQAAADILGVPLDRMFWLTGEAAETAVAEGSIGRLRESAMETVQSVARFQGARAAAERAARDAVRSDYPRVRELAGAIADELMHATLRDVLITAEAQWDELRRGYQPGELSREGHPEGHDWSAIAERVEQAVSEDERLAPDLLQALKSSQEGRNWLVEVDRRRRRQWAIDLAASPRLVERQERLASIGREMFGERGPATKKEVDAVWARAKKQGFKGAPWVFHRLADDELELIIPAEADSKAAADDPGEA